MIVAYEVIKTTTITRVSLDCISETITTRTYSYLDEDKKDEAWERFKNLKPKGNGWKVTTSDWDEYVAYRRINDTMEIKVSIGFCNNIYRAFGED